MKDYKRFIILFSLFIVVDLAIIIGININIDNYGIFRTDFSKQIIEPNQNYDKMRYILGHKAKYDSFIFGSSRVGKINPFNIHNGKYYNFTYADGLPEEHLKNIKILLKNGVKIKNILLGLDDFSYRLNPSDHKKSLLNMPYPSNVFEEVTLFTDYFLRIPNKFTEKDVIQRLNYDVENSGRPICKDCDIKIDEKPLEHLKDKKFNVPTHFENKNVYFQNTVSDIKELVKICKENKIKLVIFINPIHKTSYLANNITNFNKFKKELSQFTDYYDFSGLNKITTDNLMYYETSHYRVKVGDMIINEIFNSKHKNYGCNSFGAYVTAYNIDAHLSCLTNDLKKN